MKFGRNFSTHVFHTINADVIRLYIGRVYWFSPDYMFDVIKKTNFQNIAALLFIMPFALCAQITMPLTIDRAIAIGLDRSKSLHASQMKVVSADAVASEAGASRLPSLSFSASYTRLSEFRRIHLK